jgi:hypothetical protein
MNQDALNCSWIKINSATRPKKLHKTLENQEIMLMICKLRPPN